jgi:hypothetical protein
MSRLGIVAICLVTGFATYLALVAFLRILWRGHL